MTTPITIRPATPADIDAWKAMRAALWHDWDPTGFEEEARTYFRDHTIGLLPHIVLIATTTNDDPHPIALAEASLRQYAEGAETSPVGYLEAWFVDQRHRHQGIGRALVDAAKRWARENGCSEFASDTEIENERSRAAHRALGFREACAIRCFITSL
ncbi:MAG: N-acetyltransferase family protein [Phycisphaerales bacterium]